MSKVLVIFDSKTGNTEMMAKAVVEGISLVKGVEVELLRAGTPFSITRLNLADAIIIGSPTRYGNVTSEMRILLDAVKEHTESNKLGLSGKAGGVFSSYAWDGGWVTYKLEAEMEAWGIKIVGDSVSAVDRMGAMGVRIDKESLKKCLELGKTIAEKVTGKTS